MEFKSLHNSSLDVKWTTFRVSAFRGCNCLFSFDHFPVLHGYFEVILLGYSIEFMVKQSPATDIKPYLTWPKSIYHGPRYTLQGHFENQWTTQTCRKPTDVEKPGDTVNPSSTGKGITRWGVSKTRTPASWVRLGMYSIWFTNKSRVRPVK